MWPTWLQFFSTKAEEKPSRSLDKYQDTIGHSLTRRNEHIPRTVQGCRKPFFCVRFLPCDVSQQMRCVCAFRKKYIDVASPLCSLEQQILLQTTSTNFRSTSWWLSSITNWPLTKSWSQIGRAKLENIWFTNRKGNIWWPPMRHKWIHCRRKLDAQVSPQNTQSPMAKKPMIEAAIPIK